MFSSPFATETSALDFVTSQKYSNDDFDDSVLCSSEEEEDEEDALSLSRKKEFNDADVTCSTSSDTQSLSLKKEFNAVSSEQFRLDTFSSRKQKSDELGELQNNTETRQRYYSNDDVDSVLCSSSSSDVESLYRKKELNVFSPDQFLLDTLSPRKQNYDELGKLQNNTETRQNYCPNDGFDDSVLCSSSSEAESLSRKKESNVVSPDQFLLDMLSSRKQKSDELGELQNNTETTQSYCPNDDFDDSVLCSSSSEDDQSLPREKESNVASPDQFLLDMLSSRKQKSDELGELQNNMETTQSYCPNDDFDDSVLCSSSSEDDQSLPREKESNVFSSNQFLLDTFSSRKQKSDELGELQNNTETRQSYCPNDGFDDSVLCSSSSSEALSSSRKDEPSSAVSYSDTLSTFTRSYQSTKFSPSDEILLKKLLSSTIQPSSIFGDNYSVQDELPINKLRYDDVSFVGREVESEKLRSVFKRVILTDDSSSSSSSSSSGETEFEIGFPVVTEPNKEMVFIKGYSGCGKSTLASQLKDWTSELEDGLFVQGKFEITSKTPYAGVVQVFAAICNKLKLGTEGDLFKNASAMSFGEAMKIGEAMMIGDELISELGSELHKVVSLIPEMRSILPLDFEEQISGLSSLLDENFEAAQEQWKNVFRILMRAFGKCFSPLVIVLDDLQWTDMASLSVIETLVTDKQNPNPLMIVGCYRSNEVDDSHALSRMMSSLTEKTEKRAFTLTEIELENISLGGVNKIIMSLLGIDDEDVTKELAQVCFNRTLGNPFFLIQFVTMLEAEGLISFSPGMLKWVWDIQVVEQSTMSTKNVVDLLVARMKKLPDEIQLILQYAANLGATFNENLVQKIWYLHSSSNNDSIRQVGMQRIHEVLQKARNLRSMYDILERHHYVERSRDGGYIWAHDNVQEAALKLGKASDPEFQFEIGTILYNNLDEHDLEESLFDVLNLINKGRAQRPVLFSRLNLRAARKAQRLSAFDIAARYCSHGIELLHDEKWSPMHHELTFSLMVLGCEMELASGNVEGMERYAEEVLARDGCTTLEKLPVYLSMAHKLESIDLHYKKALELYLSVLKDLGCSVPRSKALITVQGLRNLMKIAKKVRRDTTDYAQSLPLMTDERQKAIMTLLNRASSTAYCMKNPFLMIYTIARSYDMTMKYGVFEKSGNSAAGLAISLLRAIKDYEVASRLMQSGMALQKRAPSRYNEAVILFMAAYGVLAWTMPLLECATMMSEAYRLGIKSGNVRYTMYALVWKSVYFPLQQGIPLRKSLAEASRPIEIMDDFSQNEQAMQTSMFCQVMANLAGDSAEPLELRGKWFVNVEWIPQTPILKGNLQAQRLVLLVFFGHYEEAADLALEIGDDFAKFFPANSFCQFEAFMRGIALCVMARKTRKRKYRKAAKKILCTIDGWVKKENPNVKHYLCLLKAEQAAFEKRHMETESWYKEAVAISSGADHFHIAGLASQRYADYLLVDRKDRDEARFRMEQAIRFYKEWGADGVISRLQDDVAES